MSEGCGDKCPRAAAPGARPGTELLLRHLPPGSPSDRLCCGAEPGPHSAAVGALCSMAVKTGAQPLALYPATVRGGVRS